MTRYDNAASIPQHIVDKMNPVDRKALKLRTSTEITEKVETGDERKLQAACESWLTLNGYRRRTPDDITGMNGDCAGWFIHMHDAKRNPILGDLLILKRDGSYLEIELKAHGGRLSPEQAALSSYQWVRVCRTLKEFIGAMA